MNKLTAEKCRTLIEHRQEDQRACRLTILGELYLQALEIALPVLEQKEKSERNPNHAQCCAEAGGDISICDCVKKDWVYLAQPQPSTTPQIDNDGWVEWGGGMCPVDEDAMVDVRFRDGSIDKNLSAGDWNWGVSPDLTYGRDIIAYRVIENDGREG